MLSKEELKQKNTMFWGEFKTQMKIHMSANGRRINWLKYPTDVKDLYLRLHADSKSCSLNFDIQCKDDGVREVVWEQLTELKVVLTNEMGDEGDWIENYRLSEGHIISRISWIRFDLNYFNEEDIPKIHLFLKERIRSFDRFYQEYKDILLNLLT